MIGALPCRRVAVVAPHPDDEVLGCGGTMARLAAEGADVHVIVVTRGQEPAFSRAYMDEVMQEASQAHECLGVSKTHRLDLPAAALDDMPGAEVNRALGDCLSAIAPDTLFVPFLGDIHLDHQIVFTAAMVWARPRSGNCPAHVLAYETLSETNWFAPGVTPAFTPNVFVDISGQLDRKLAAFALFRSQVKRFPDERSPESIRALAMLRGSTAYCEAAEGFMNIRQIWRVS